MKWVASPGSMHDTGCLGLVHWDDPEGWYGEGGGTHVYLWRIHFDIWLNQYNIVKLKNKIIKKKKVTWESRSYRKMIQGWMLQCLLQFFKKSLFGNQSGSHQRREQRCKLPAATHQSLESTFKGPACSFLVHRLKGLLRSFHNMKWL